MRYQQKCCFLRALQAPVRRTSLQFCRSIYCYFQGSVWKTAPENEIAGESSQCQNRCPTPRVGCMVTVVLCGSGLDQPKGTDDPKCTSSPRMWFSAPVSEVFRGETRRPVWGLMDKCYPVTTQRLRVEWEQTNLRGHDPQGNKRTKCRCPQGGDWHLVSG
ncbi:Inactive Ubiquitin Carboxyl-Terminal Hydrolase Mindy-4B [Manis pentadactyla]|nr:Inactive Ubiquitin Carboxyl-Terminal Hydrolase Mindy-4B [Manis pentadactyla]